MIQLVVSCRLRQAEFKMFTGLRYRHEMLLLNSLQKLSKLTVVRDNIVLWIFMPLSEVVLG